MTKQDDDTSRPRAISRRELIKLAATAGLLAGCRPLEQLVTPTSAPAATNTPVPTATSTPTPVPPPTRVPTPTVVMPTPLAVRRPDIIQMYPAVPSKVVYTRHAGVWSGKSLVPAAIRKMLDASITALTGQNDARAAWAALFAPDERIAIKINTFRNSLIWTHIPLVKAVTDSLQAAGIPPEQIFVFDYFTNELQTAQFTINRDGPGVRYYGTDSNYTTKVQICDRNIRLSDVLLNCHAVINMPVLKSHMITGLTFGMKNHYGTIDNPEALHYGDECIPALNALPPIKDRTRLIIGDILEACLEHTSRFPYWEADMKGDSILMSFDPVAHDAVGLDLFKQFVTAAKGDPTARAETAKVWLDNAVKLGLGTNDPQNIKRVEVALK